MELVGERGRQLPSKHHDRWFCSQGVMLACIKGICKFSKMYVSSDTCLQHSLDVPIHPLDLVGLGMVWGSEDLLNTPLHADSSKSLRSKLGSIVRQEGLWRAISGEQLSNQSP